MIAREHSNRKSSRFPTLLRDRDVIVVAVAVAAAVVGCCLFFLLGLFFLVL